MLGLSEERRNIQRDKATRMTTKTTCPSVVRFMKLPPARRRAGDGQKEILSFAIPLPTNIVSPISSESRGSTCLASLRVFAGEELQAERAHPLRCRMTIDKAQVDTAPMSANGPLRF